MKFIVRVLDEAAHRSPWPRRYGLGRYWLCQWRCRQEAPR